MGVSLRPRPVFATKVVRGLEGVDAMIKPCNEPIEDVEIEEEKFCFYSCMFRPLMEELVAVLGLLRLKRSESKIIGE